MIHGLAIRPAGRTVRVLALTLLTVGGMGVHSTSAQGTRAAISGTVKNAAGVGQATVTVILTNNETGIERRGVTEADGTFVFGGLQPGTYVIRVQEAGFAPYTGEPISLQAAQRVEVTISLIPSAQPAAPQPSPAPPPQAPSRPPPPVSPAPVQPPVQQPSSTLVRTVDAVPDYIPTPDRWALEFPVWQRYPRGVKGDYPYVEGRKIDPYNRNILKGDYPIIGQDIFFVLTAVSETPFEYRRVPTPAGVSAERQGSEQFFGRGEQLSTAPEAILSLELFRGDTSFKPRAWAVRVTPVFNLNYINTGERNVVSVTPEQGKARRRTDLALQEAFGEIKLTDVGPNYDFISVRAGIQPFTSDFRGFLYRDTNLGVRLFGNWDRNRNQWNIAYFDQLEKETNSELNLIDRRNQRVIIANYYRQDFLTPGYTISPSFHANFDRGQEPFFDANGFLVRPSPVGLIQPHRVTSYYAGIGGDGHWGRLNVTHQFYQVFGTDYFNGIAGQRVEIDAQFAAVEASVDHDWWRLKGAVLFASGDANPADNKARGFDAIFDNPNIAGGPFSFWNREGIRLTGTLVELKGRNSLLTSLRSSKIEGQASFVNPGLIEYSGGWDADLTEKLRTTVNVNLLRFHHTEVLSALLFQRDIDKSIGLDYSVGFQYRPYLNDNVTVTFGGALFTPLPGFKKILTSDTLFSPFAALTVRY